MNSLSISTPCRFYILSISKRAGSFQYISISQWYARFANPLIHWLISRTSLSLGDWRLAWSGYILTGQFGELHTDARPVRSARSLLSARQRRGLSLESRLQAQGARYAL